MSDKENKKSKSALKVKPTADRNELRRLFYEGIDRNEWGLRVALRKFRLMLGMTQSEFAEFTGVPRRVVMEFEQGRGNPTLKTLEKLLKGSGLKIGLQRAPK
jgi:DNA-binding XRE family transcriptional regulator